ncbi:MAG: acyl carrier protein [Dechloromonas sp.]|nr:acyl carrier protein [Candidatus Dechloromonas phosphoritropha]MBP8787890.1 acyl carrier protein [Azonexus sp.]
MNRGAIFEDLVDFVIKVQGNDVPIDEETVELFDSKVLDSLDIMGYLTYIEKKYGVKITDQDVADRKLGVIRNMIQFIYERSKG